MSTTASVPGSEPFVVLLRRVRTLIAAAKRERQDDPFARSILDNIDEALTRLESFRPVGSGHDPAGVAGNTLVESVGSRLQVSGPRPESVLYGGGQYATKDLSELGYRAGPGVLGIVVIDRDGTIIDANDSFLEIVGYTREDVQARRIRWEELTPLEYRTQLRASFEQVRNTGQCSAVESEYIRKDGSRVPVLMDLSVLDTAMGRSIGHVFDLSYRRRMEQELIESEERFHALAEASRDGVVIYADGVVLDANPAFAEMFGYSLDEVVGRRLETFLAPEFHDIFEQYEQELPGEHREPREIQGVRKDGTRMDLEVVGRSRAWRGRTVKIGAFRDVTARKRAEEAQRFLAEASALLVSTLDGEATLERLVHFVVPYLADYCYIEMLEPDGWVHRVAAAHVVPQAESLLQRSKKFLLQPTQPDLTGTVATTGRSLLLSEVTHEYLASVARDHADLVRLRALQPHSIMVVPVVARERVLGVFTLAVCHRDRRYTERELGLAEELARRVGNAVDNARLYQEARQAIQTRDEFLSIASHELRVPLAALQIQLQALERNVREEMATYPPAARTVEALERAVRQTWRLIRLLDQLLDVGRIAAGKLTIEPEELDLSALVQDVVNSFSYELRRAGCAATVNTQGSVVGWWDRLRIEQVVTNLISNAVKYAPGRPIEITVARTGNNVRLTVKDHGPGIPPDKVGKIFERFEQGTARNGRTGLGLGLYITRQIVQAHGGSIRVESKPGEGTTFIVDLPVEKRN